MPSDSATFTHIARSGSALALGRAEHVGELEGIPLRLLRPADTITIDEIPGYLWPQAISVRLFGFHSWQIEAWVPAHCSTVPAAAYDGGSASTSTVTLYLCSNT
ncbi:hypothetical protein [Actinospica sp.]|uniref:hypothetical protein n=1 Tax=Actinospica sp. TaxID=1872142 RepID=UPI002C53B5B8|nr:hypothetical protein [Actinospica sp.]HWG27161.1 hypothetical protein [Actinospica sp.]